MLSSAVKIYEFLTLALQEGDLPTTMSRYFALSCGNCNDVWEVSFHLFAK
jgi:hypothetical protein